MESPDPPEPEFGTDDLPEDPAEAFDEEAEEELTDEIEPEEIEMEPEEISSGVDVLAPDGTKKKRVAGPDVIRDQLRRLPGKPGVYRR